MNCKEIQELLLSDYIDGELDKSKEAELQRHLGACPECLESFALIRKTAIDPLARAGKVDLSEDALWRTIESRIQKENAVAVSPDALPDIIAILKQWFVFPRIAFALSVVLIFSMTALYFNRDRREEVATSASAEIKTQEQFLAYMDMDLTDDESSDTEGYGTAIEEYFL